MLKVDVQPLLIKLGLSECKELARLTLLTAPHDAIGHGRSKLIRRTSLRHSTQRHLKIEVWDGVLLLTKRSTTRLAGCRSFTTAIHGCEVRVPGAGLREQNL